MRKLFLAVGILLFGVSISIAQYTRPGSTDNNATNEFGTVEQVNLHAYNPVTNRFDRVRLSTGSYLYVYVPTTTIVRISDDGTNPVDVSYPAISTSSQTYTLSTRSFLMAFNGTSFDLLKIDDIDNLMVRASTNSVTCVSEDGTNMVSVGYPIINTSSQTYSLTNRSFLYAFDGTDFDLVNIDASGNLKVVTSTASAIGSIVCSSTTANVSVYFPIALPAGTNNIGDVDILSVIAASDTNKSTVYQGSNPFEIHTSSPLTEITVYQGDNPWDIRISSEVSEITVYQGSDPWNVHTASDTSEISVYFPTALPNGTNNIGNILTVFNVGESSDTKTHTSLQDISDKLNPLQNGVKIASGTVTATQLGLYIIQQSSPIATINQDYETKVSTYIAGSLVAGGAITATGMYVDNFSCMITTGSATVNWGGGNEIYFSSAYPFESGKYGRTINAPVFTFTNATGGTIYYYIGGVE